MRISYKSFIIKSMLIFMFSIAASLSDMFLICFSNLLKFILCTLYFLYWYSNSYFLFLALYSFLFFRISFILYDEINIPADSVFKLSLYFTLYRSNIALLSALSNVNTLFRVTTNNETKNTPQNATNTPIILPTIDLG